MSDTSPAPRVYIIDDDAAVRDSLAFLCTAAGHLAQAYATPLAFLDVADTLSEGCVLTDVRMPEMDGITLISQLRERRFALPIIVMTGHGDVPMAVAAMKVGAMDFLEKPFDDEAMLSAVSMALRIFAGGDPGISAGDAAVQTRLTQLSERERQVLDGLLEGHANKVIAQDLGISPRTVEIYRAKVMTKMQAASLAELVRMVVTKTV